MKPVLKLPFLFYFTELVHFLFTPLALIVDASHDSHYGPNLPSKVVSPLLTSEAIDLLINCLTSKESELWNSLGDAWYIPENEWKGYVPPFRPVFTDGFRQQNLPEEEDNQLESIGIDEVDGSMRKQQFQSDSDMEAPLPPPPAGLLRTVGRPGNLNIFLWGHSQMTSRCSKLAILPASC